MTEMGFVGELSPRSLWPYRTSAQSDGRRPCNAGDSTRLSSCWYKGLFQGGSPGGSGTGPAAACRAKSALSSLI